MSEKLEKVEDNKKLVYVNKNVLDAQKEYIYNINEMGKCEAVKLKELHDDKELTNRAARATTAIMDTGKSIAISYGNQLMFQMDEASGTKTGTMIRTSATVASLAVNSAVRHHRQVMNDMLSETTRNTINNLANNGIRSAEFSGTLSIPGLQENMSPQEASRLINQELERLGGKPIQGQGMAGAINAQSMYRRQWIYNRTPGHTVTDNDWKIEKLLKAQQQIMYGAAYDPKSNGSFLKKAPPSSIKQGIGLVMGSAKRYMKQDDTFKGLVMSQTIVKRTVQTAKQALKAIHKINSLARMAGHKIAIQMASIRLSSINRRLSRYVAPTPGSIMPRRQARLLNQQRRWTNIRTGNNPLARFGRRVKDIINYKPRWLRTAQDKLTEWLHPIKSAKKYVRGKVGSYLMKHSVVFRAFNVLRQWIEELKRKVRAIIFGAICFLLIIVIIVSILMMIISAFDMSGVSKTDRLKDYLMSLYENDFEYLSLEYNGYTITYIDVKDEELYSEYEEEASSDNFQESTNFAEILSMLYYMNDMDFEDKSLEDLEDQAEYLYYSSREITVYTYGSGTGTIEYKTYYFDSIYDCEYNENYVGWYDPGFGTTSMTQSYTVPTEITLSETTSTEAAIWLFFINQGFSKVATAAIMGNMQAESGFDTTAENASYHYGLCQWDVAIRKQRLITFAGGEEYISDLNTQLEFIIYELDNYNYLNNLNNYVGSSFKTYGSNIDEDDEEAISEAIYKCSRAWQNNYEVCSSATDTRFNYSKSIYQRFANYTGAIYSYHQTTSTHTYTYNGRALPSSGCCITSYADCLAALGVTYNGHTITPIDVYDINGRSVSVCWSTGSNLVNFIEDKGIYYSAKSTSASIPSEDEIAEWIESGGYWIWGFGGATYNDGHTLAGSTHYVVLCYVLRDSNNGILGFGIANPGSGNIYTINGQNGSYYEGALETRYVTYSTMQSCKTSCNLWYVKIGYQ